MDLYFHFPCVFDDDRKIINSFQNILRYVKSYPDYKIYYSDSNIRNYKNLNDESGTYLTDDIKIIRQFLSSRRAFKIEEEVRVSEINYYQWNLENFEVKVCENALILISTKLYVDLHYKYILLNLENGIDSCRNKILVFRDCKHLDYPDNFIKIDFVINYIELVEWLKTNHITEFSLKDENRFQKKPSIRVQGVTVYLEIHENRYWHLDNFHNYVEYEVYDSNGNHYATANESGELDLRGRISGRSITIS